VLLLHRRPGRRMGDTFDRVVCVSHHGPLGADAEVDPAAGIWLAWAARRLGDDRGHRDEQPAAQLAEGHRQHPSSTLREQPLKPPSALLATQPPDDWEDKVTAVGIQAKRAGAEPDPAMVAMSGLEPRESDPTPGAMAMLGSRPVVQAGDEVGDPRCIGFLGTARPPRRDLGLGLIPAPAQSGQVPGQRLHRRIDHTGIQVGSDLRQRPVIRKPPGSEMLLDQRPLPRRGRLHLEPPPARDETRGNLVVPPSPHQTPSPPRPGGVPD
jgi:hypothetical protein